MVAPLRDTKALFDDATRQRIAIGMQAFRRKANQHVAGAHARTVQQVLALDHANQSADEIKLAFRVDTGHFSGFTAQQCHAVICTSMRDASDCLADHGRIKLAYPDVIEEEQWFRALHQRIVDAVLDQAAPDRIETPNRGGDPNLCADAIGGANQYRLLA